MDAGSKPEARMRLFSRLLAGCLLLAAKVFDCFIVYTSSRGERAT